MNSSEKRLKVEGLGKDFIATSRQRILLHIVCLYAVMAKIGVRRLSIGLRDWHDIIHDLGSALEQI